MSDRPAPLLPGIFWQPSPNFNERRRPVTEIILHYTGMKAGDDPLARMCDPEAKVSAHYYIAADGSITQMVALDKRAWHAGVALWRGADDINSSSVGIELDNPGHEWGYRPFPAAQMASCVQLVAAIKAHFGIDRANVIGHSDIAPARKEDPGELFDWPLLARHGLALGPPALPPTDPQWSDTQFGRALEQFGYDARDLKAATIAFQRRFRPQNIDGQIDRETRTLLHLLQVQEAERRAGVGLA